MKKRTKDKNIKINLILSGLLFALGLFFIWQALYHSGDVFPARAAQNDNVRGWGWSENIGWISMNCYNDFTAKCSGGTNPGVPCLKDSDCDGGTCLKDGTFENCCPGGNLEDCPYGLAGTNYGVNYDNSYNKLTGWGWSENAGWICFGETCQEVCLGGTNDGQSCSGGGDCPGGVCGGNTPHGFPVPWACVGQQGWLCQGGSNPGEVCYSDDDCSGGLCRFSCVADAEEGFNDSGVCTQEQHLKGHWQMNEVGETIDDDSNNNNQGILMPTESPAFLVKGKFGNALQFNGNSQYIEIPDHESLSVTGNLTVEAWVKRSSLGSEQTILGKWDESVSQDGGYRLWFGTDNNLNFTVTNGSTQATITQKKGLCVGQTNVGEEGCLTDADCLTGEVCKNAPVGDTRAWHHVAGKYVAATSAKPASLQLFIDGSRLASVVVGDIPDSLGNGTQNFYLGAKKVTSVMDTFFHGALDNVSVWSCQNEGKILGRNTKEIWDDAKKEIDGWARVISLGDRGWLKLKGFDKDGRVWGTSLKDFSPFYIFEGYMANRWVNEDVFSNGLLAHWKLNEPFLGNNYLVQDSSGNGQHGTPYGPQADNRGIFNSAANFDGTDDYIDFTDSYWSGKFTDTAEVTNDFTISAWIRLNAYPLEYTTIIGQRYGDTMVFGVTPSGLLYLNMDDTRTASPKNNTALDLDKWYHVVVVFNGHGSSSSNANFYVNGIADGGGTAWDGSGTGNQSYLYFGRQGRTGIGADSYFNGLIDNVAIYNRALTGVEINQLYLRHIPYCMGWGDSEHGYDDPPEPLDFNNLGLNNNYGCDQLLVQWEVSDWAQSYTYHRCNNVTEGDCGTCTYIETSVLDESCDVSGCSLTDPDLSANTGYCYKIKAENETGETWNSEGGVWSSTLLCALEEGEIDNPTCGQIDLTWEPVTDSEGYNVYRALSADGCETVSSSGCDLIAHLGEAMGYDGLVAYWKMNQENWTEEDVYDSSGNAYHGTASAGAYPLTGVKFNSAAHFNGSGYIDVGNIQAHNNSDYTIEFWLKGTPQNNNLFYSEFNNGLAGPLFSFGSGQTNTSRAKIFVKDDDGETALEIESSNNVLDDSWHHLAWVDQIGEYVLYVDGEIDSSGNYIKVVKDFNSSNLGRHNVNSEPGSYFTGLLDNFAIYNRAKTHQEIKIDYETGTHQDCHLGAEDNCASSIVCNQTDCGAGVQVCCPYSDFRIIPFIDYYYVITAVSKHGESEPGPSPAMNSKTICFPPLTEEEE
jgi:hypothetical protein